jgi:hypothetical protein
MPAKAAAAILPATLPRAVTLQRVPAATKLGATKLGATKLGATKVAATKVAATKVPATMFGNLVSRPNNLEPAGEAHLRVFSCCSDLSVFTDSERLN